LWCVLELAAWFEREGGFPAFEAGAEGAVRQETEQ